MENATDNYPRINIIFRSCDSVTAVHHAPRPFNLDKKTLIKICFKSLHNAIQAYNCRIIVLGDNLSDEMKQFFLSYNTELREGIFGNDNSIRETVKIAQEFNDDEWVYFCEDDYLHTPDAIHKICTLIKEKHTVIPPSITIKKRLRKKELTLLSVPRFMSEPEITIFPADYPDRYNIVHNRPRFIFHTSDSHWRQVTDITFTFLMKVSSARKHKNTLIKAARGANDRYLSEKLLSRSFFFTKMLCVSPLPSLSTHMHTHTMSPLVHWEALAMALKNKVA
ncbi:hypothetical protein ACLI09_00725 [Flavobacterium sp. RHBU_24]|uniref:hypothetical protein n=1 Tax=Flavobacterium sp. RHBU_24 TaxID=3391185 RepID=UPI003984856C